MPISPSKDWKYVVMLVVTIAGVFSPIWITRFQLPDKQVLVREISQSAIQSVTKGTVPDLQLMVDGTPLSDPYYSVLEISNDGDRPIVVRDFEAPLEIQLGKDRAVVRARVSEKSPTDVTADVTWEKNIVRLAPTLLNPKDKLIVAVLSTGGAPEFVVRARIAGVGSVPVIKTEKQKPKLVLSIMLLAGAFLCAVPSLAAYSRWTPFAPKGTLVMLRLRTTLAMAFVLQFTAIGLVISLLSIHEIESYWQSMLAIFAVFVISFPFARLLEPHSANDHPSEPKL